MRFVGKSILSSLVFLLSTGSVFAIMSPHQGGDIQSLWGGDEISMAAPSTHGELTPRLSGNLAQTWIHLGENKVYWFANSNSRGAVQLWGEPILYWDESMGVEEMDRVLRQLVAQNPNLFGVAPKELELDSKKLYFAGAHRYVTYKRYWNGLPVEGAYLSFRFKDRRLVQVTNHSFGKIQSAAQPLLSAEEALESVYFDAQFDLSKDKVVGMATPEVQPFYKEDGSIEFRYVYQVTLAKEFPKGLWQYSVSAATGEIVRLMNKFAHAGQVGGEIYHRNHEDDLSLVPFGDLAVFESGNSPVFTDPEGGFDAQGDRVVATLMGKRARIKIHGQKYSPQLQGDAQGDLFFSAQETLSENMAYYHVTQVNTLVSEHLAGKFLQRPISVNTRVRHPVIKQCNAWFDPREMSLNFLEPSSQCEGSARISDIIYHEWGHFLDESLGGISDPAFSEAIGDIMSLMMTGSPEIGPGFIRETGSGIRDLTAVKVYPRDRARDPHTEGLIVGGAWFETFNNLRSHYGDEEGRAIFAKIFLKHLVGTDNYLDSYMGALLVDDDDGSLENCTPNMCLINAAFARRGLTQYDQRCLGDDSMGLPACAESTIR